MKKRIISTCIFLWGLRNTIMKKIYIFILFLILILLTGCKKKQIQIREHDFYDYIYAENTRVKGYLVNNSSKDLYNLEKYLYNCTKKILSKEFIQESVEKINNQNLNGNDKKIEIDFFRVSKEIPWKSKDKYIPPYHLGEGNPSDWIGRFVYSINTNQICYYYVCIRSDSLVKYGKIIRHIEYKQ